LSIDRLTTNPASGFSDAVTTSGPGRTIHVSGNVGFGDEGKVVSGGMEAELSHVVRITAFITNLDEYAGYAKVRAEVFGDQLPASATVQVAGLLVGAQIEIDAVAFVPEG
jgi:2-iminobutanoate/2-iminopropanoate deaminase